MRRPLWFGVLVVALILESRGLGAQPERCEPSPDCYLKRLGPIGGWNPYGGGLLHWWDPCCFPHCGGPDDYCRKPLHKVCWPPYPPFYIWGTPANGCLHSPQQKAIEKTQN